MNFRGLFKVAAVCAIGYAAVSLASYIASVSANGFLIANAGFIAGQDVIGNVGIFLNMLALAASYLTAGALLREASKEEAQSGVQASPRAASASA